MKYGPLIKGSNVVCQTIFYSLVMHVTQRVTAQNNGRNLVVSAKETHATPEMASEHTLVMHWEVFPRLSILSLACSVLKVCQES